jgi:hypothetical protein
MRAWQYCRCQRKTGSLVVAGAWPSSGAIVAVSIIVFDLPRRSRHSHRAGIVLDVVVVKVALTRLGGTFPGRDTVQLSGRQF